MSWYKQDLTKLYAIDFYSGDRATEVLAQTFKALHDAAWLKLSMDGQHAQKCMPSAEIALPSWFFTKMSPFPDGYQPHGSDLSIRASHLETLNYRISTALHRAGFRRSPSSRPQEVLWEHNSGDRSAQLVGRGIAPYISMHSLKIIDSQRARFEEPPTRSQPHADQNDKLPAATVLFEWTASTVSEYGRVFYAPHGP